MNLQPYQLSAPAGLAVLVALAFVFAIFVWRTRPSAASALRPIAAFEILKHVLSQAVEEAKPVHVSIGVAGAGAASTVDTTAGLYTLEFLADRSAVSALPPIVTASDPTALPLAQQQLARAFRREGYAEEYNPRQARWIAPAVNGSAVPYAAGVMDIVTHERVMANVMVGSFGDEILLMSEPGAQRGLIQAGGTSSVQALPFVYTSISNPLIGEEIYAGGAYLSSRASHLSSLVAQDVMRWLVVGFLVVAIILRTLGLI